VQILKYAVPSELRQDVEILSEYFFGSAPSWGSCRCGAGAPTGMRPVAAA